MFKTILAIAATTLTIAPAVAQASEARQFSHEGVNYAYTTEQKGDVTVINGRTSSGEPFRLFVKGERVTGSFNNHSVSFTKAEAARIGVLTDN